MTAATVAPFATGIVVLPDAEMGPSSLDNLTGGKGVPCALVMTVDADLLAALARTAVAS